MLLSTGAYLSCHTATYDPVGNRLGVMDTIDTEGSFGVSYTYDPANQLLSEQRSGPTVVNTSYTYDGPGNRKTMTSSGAVTTYSYNAAIAMTLIVPASGASTTLSYDPNGNLLGGNVGGSLSTFTCYRSKIQ